MTYIHGFFMCAGISNRLISAHICILKQTPLNSHMHTFPCFSVMYEMCVCAYVSKTEYVYLI